MEARTARRRDSRVRASGVEVLELVRQSAQLLTGRLPSAAALSFSCRAGERGNRLTDFLAAPRPNRRRLGRVESLFWGRRGLPGSAAFSPSCPASLVLGIDSLGIECSGPRFETETCFCLFSAGRRPNLGRKKSARALFRKRLREVDVRLFGICFVEPRKEVSSFGTYDTTLLTRRLGKESKKEEKEERVRRRRRTGGRDAGLNFRFTNSRATRGGRENGRWESGKNPRRKRDISIFPPFAPHRPEGYICSVPSSAKCLIRYRVITAHLRP